MGSKPRLEFLRGWIGIAIVNARERLAVAMSFAVGAAAVLPAACAAVTIAFFIFVVFFAALSFPIGVTTAVWWISTRVLVRHKTSDSEIKIAEPSAKPEAVPAADPPRDAVAPASFRSTSTKTPARWPRPGRTTLVHHDDHDERGGPVHHAHVRGIIRRRARRRGARPPPRALTHRRAPPEGRPARLLLRSASLRRVRVLDLGGNELSQPRVELLAGRAAPAAVEELVRRGAPEVKELKALKELDMSRNFVRNTEDALPRRAGKAGAPAGPGLFGTTASCSSRDGGFVGWTMIPQAEVVG